MRVLAQGAEAKIIDEKNTILKQRFKKTYRIPELDNSLRQFRTRREAKVYEHLMKIKFPVPNLVSHSDKTMDIRIEKLKGKKMRDVLNSKNCVNFGKEIGRKVALMHSNGIIHGDLTTSNMIFSKEIYFIDFGLSFFSKREEDRAVDIHMFKEMLSGTHPEISKVTYVAFVSGYEILPEADAVLRKMDEVEARGRNKKKMGS